MQNKTILYAVGGVVVLGIVAWLVFGMKGQQNGLPNAPSYPSY